MSKEINHIYEFGDFRLETAERLLLRAGKPISLTPKAFQTLLVLVQSSGHLIEKNELMRQVWADAFVEEVNLARNIWTVRKALGDNTDEHRYIETVPRVGYRFVAQVTEVSDGASHLLIHRRVRARIVSEEVETSDAPQSQIEVVRPHTSPVVTALTSKRRNPRRRIALAVFGLIGLTTTIILLWLWQHSKAPINAEIGFKFLTDGRQDDEAAYWTNQGQIYFSRYLTNTRVETWTMNADGTNQHRANTEIKNLLTGRWSPNGKKIVFSKEDDDKTLYLADANGANETTLPSAMGNMDWSPDSSQFVYQVRSSDKNSQMFLYTIKTGQSTELTDNNSLNADPSFSPDGKQIAFTSDRDGNFEIYVMQTDGSNVRRLTNHPAFDSYPVFSPDGTQIAFQSNREDEHAEVYLKNLNDDTPPRRVTHSSGATGLVPKCWSPDGTQMLLYTTSQKGKNQIVLAELDPPARLVLADESADLAFPRLSVDGRKILYQARTADHTLELRLTDLETRRTRTVFKTERDYPLSFNLAPAWSPDNALIAFSSRVNGHSKIFTIKTDGSGLKNLTTIPLADTSPVFSPDGHEIVFVRDNYGRAQLYRMDLNGDNQRRVTNRDGYEMTPAFSPDGSYLAFAGDREGHGLDIFLLDMKNPNDEKIIAARRFHDAGPTFSPDGKRIVFIANSDGNPEIYLVNSDGTGLFRLTHSKAEETTPQFSKDGKALIFAANKRDKFAIYEVPLP